MADQRAGAITIVGLGPGTADLITRRTWHVLQEADAVYLRTAHHPAASELPSNLRIIPFDRIYDNAHDFGAVYEQIADRLLAAVRAGQDIVYAVPGDPAVGEATVSAVVARAQKEGISCRVLPGVSFVEPCLAALGEDALNGIQLFDAISLAGYNHPPVNPDFPVLLGQVYSRLLANELKLSLMAVYPDDHPATLIHGAGTDQEKLESLPLYEIDRSAKIDHLTSLYLPARHAPSSLQALAEAVAVLRSPEGCPWDREQTPQSLRASFTEEVAEMLEALDEQDPGSLQEEMGDLLLHIVMQAQMAREEELFRLNDVVAGIYAKIRRRHPHVWGDVQVADSDEVLANWEAIKATEKGGNERVSMLAGIPKTLPALARAQKIQERVGRVGFDWPVVEGVVAKVHEELAELQGAADSEQQSAELGDLLFSVVNWARWLGLDADTALREANRRFVARFEVMERLATERSIDLEKATLDEMESLWQEAKSGWQQESTS